MIRAVEKAVVIRRRNVSGFSLLELMIALVAGAVVISSVYYIGASSARSFQTQQRLAQLQTNVRAAMDQLTHDVGRAGFLGTPNSRRDQRCGVAPVTELQAVEFLNDVDNAKIPLAGVNGVSADRLLLVGSYATADSYLVSSCDSSGLCLLQQAWQGYRRSFGVPPLVGGVGSAYDSTFVPGRLVRLTNGVGNVFYATIVSASAPAATITVSPAFPVNSGDCFPGFGGGAILSVLSRIEYRIDDGTGFSSASLQPNNLTVTGPPTWLIRREVNFAAAATPLPIPGPTGTGPAERVVLENAIDFNLTFTLDRQTNMTLPANLVHFDGLTSGPMIANTNTNPAATPEQVRSISISISGRTPDLDTNFNFAAVPALTHFTFDVTRRGSAHVRTLRSEVFLQNQLR